jgi:3-isopropylmalate/(R)-2-methylmalate dehydratase small subunit
MQPFTTVSGPAAPLMLANIDTDVIIRIDRMTGGDRRALGRYAFEALRYLPDGAENPDFVFNRDPFRAAPILLAGPNFGCGSSRETAVWALQGLGVRCVIADGFGDIFFSNCFQNGVLPIRLPETTVADLARRAQRGAVMEIDLEAQTISFENERLAFDIDRQRKAGLLAGLDDLGLTIAAMDDIRAWQARDRTQRPWVWVPVERPGAEGDRV